MDSENYEQDENREKDNIELANVDQVSDKTANDSNELTSGEVNLTENSDKGDGKDNEIDEDLAHNPAQHTFKKPVLIIGPRKGLPTKLKTLKQDSVTEVLANTEAQPVDVPKEESLHTIENQIDKKLSLPYTEPSWSGPPDNTYKLEVLKSGVILETINLTDKNYHTVGRLPNCDIPMAHPTISRYHAVIQYRANGDEKNGKGLYVYDLDSTHGTFWNGNRVRPRVYVRLQGGHMIKFGCSQRKFIVQAPEDDQEEESEYTVTQLKEMRKLQLEEREKIEKQRALEEEEKERLRQEKEENEGIDWGMGEDADEETDLTENPYAQTNNEELFLDDPKKTLRGWFEREGLDLQYQTEDKGIGRYLCWVELPLDNRSVRAEALVTGKKKEAVVQCALEACRVLDRYGLLRQATHEARKRKTRNWEEEDFYDSDEDNFLDRTGTIEKKRKQRMKVAGKLDTKAETYDSLLDNHSKITEKIAKLERTIALQKLKQQEEDNSNVDALDAFMSTLSSSVFDKTEIRKMKMDLINLRKEELQLVKLINIAKPANLPPLKPSVSNTDQTIKSQVGYKNIESVIGSKKKLKSPAQKNETVTVLQSTTVNKTVDKDKSKEDKDNVDQDKLEYEEKNEKIQKIEQQNSEETREPNQKQTLSSVVKPINEVKNIDTSDTEENEKLETTTLKKKNKNVKRNQQRKGKEIPKDYDEEEYREDYSMWLPPQNQSGDGKTSLNDKFGY